MKPINKSSPHCRQTTGQALLAAAHTLKGVAGNLGLIPLSNICLDTVALLRAEQYMEAVASCAKIRDADTGFIEIIRLLEEA